MHTADGALPQERLVGGWQPLEHGSTLICWADLQNCTSSSLLKGERESCEVMFFTASFNVNHVL